MRAISFRSIPCAVDLFEVRDLDAGEIFERQDLGRGERPVHERDLDLRVVGEVPGKGLGVLPFLEIVQLLQDDAGELGVDHVEVDMAVEHAEDPDHELEGAHIRRDHLVDAGILDLDHDAVPVPRQARCTWPSEADAIGVFVKGRKNLVHGPQLLGDPLRRYRGRAQAAPGPGASKARRCTPREGCPRARTGTGRS